MVSRRHFEQLLAAYVEQYNRARPHRSLNLTPPHPATVAGTAGTIRRRDVLGGLIHEYDLATRPGPLTMPCHYRRRLRRSANGRRDTPRDSVGSGVRRRSYASSLGRVHLALAGSGSDCWTFEANSRALRVANGNIPVHRWCRRADVPNLRRASPSFGTEPGPTVAAVIAWPPCDQEHPAGNSLARSRGPLEVRVGDGSRPPQPGQALRAAPTTPVAPLVKSHSHPRRARPRHEQTCSRQVATRGWQERSLRFTPDRTEQEAGAGGGSPHPVILE